MLDNSRWSPSALHWVNLIGCRVVVQVLLLGATHDVVCCAAVVPWSWFRCVGEGESRGVNDPIVAHQANRNLSGLPDPGPAAPELRDIGHHAQHALLTPVHCLAFHVPEPDSEVGREALARQLQHGHVAATVEVEAVHHGHRRHRASHRTHALVELVLNLIS